MSLGGCIFGCETWQVDSLLDSITIQHKDKNPICEKGLNDWEICSKDTEDNMGDKLVHSIDSEIKIAESIDCIGALFEMNWLKPIWTSSLRAIHKPLRL